MKRIMLVMLVSYLGYALLMFFIQTNLIYPGVQLSPVKQLPSLGVKLETLQLKLPEGIVLARFLPASGTGKRYPAVIVCHGNMELADNLLPQFIPLHRMGVGVLLLEYPGFSGMPGKPGEASVTAAAVAAYDALVQRNDVDAERIVALGRSLGGGVACSLARHRPLRALILLSTFTSLRPMAARYLLPSFMLRDTFDNISTLESYDGPVLIIHGRQDRIIPFEHGKQLALAGRRAILVGLEGGHNDIIESPGFWPVIKEFMKDEKIVKFKQEGA